jgi:hypothetical protein
VRCPRLLSPLVPMDHGTTRSAGSALTLLGVVTLTTAAAISGFGPSAAELSFSPHRLAQGRVWLLPVSALLVDRPILLSLASFALLAFVTMAVCGRVVFWRSAICGHIGSTLTVYLFIALSRSVDPGAFGSTLNARDYGVSAISSAWLGSTATTAWRMRANRRWSKAAIAAGCGAVAVFAYMMRRDTSVLTSEHLVAFGIGIGVAVAPGALTNRGRLLAQRFWARRGAAVAAVGCAAVIVLGTAEAPEAFGQLKALLVPPGLTAAGCTRLWNDAARRALASGGDFSAVTVDVIKKRHAGRLCRFGFSGGPQRTVEFVAALHRGRLGPLHRADSRSAPANGEVLPNGTIRLIAEHEDLDAFTSV